MKQLKTLVPPVEENESLNPCEPSPCGANAICKERNGVGSCLCLPEYFGDPYTGCRPECVQNSQCDQSKACINNKCKDPCPGVCGINAVCTVRNHAPNCFCDNGYTGNPSVSCNRLEISKFIASLFERSLSENFFSFKYSSFLLLFHHSIHISLSKLFLIQ